MKKTVLLFTSLFIFTGLAVAQDRLLTIDDIFDPQKRVAFSGRPIQIRGWSGDGRTYLEFVNGSMFRVDPVTGERRSLVDSSAMADSLIKAGIQSDAAKRIAGAPLQIFNSGETAILFEHDTDIWVYTIGDGNVRRLTKDKDKELEPDFSPDGLFVSFVRNNNLFVVDIGRGIQRQLTRDGGEKILNGYLDWVYEEELYGRGNKRGYWWSPDSRYIAFLRTDESPVPKFLLIDETVTDQRVENTDYPQAGDPNPLVRLAVAEVKKSPVLPNVGRIPVAGSKLPPSVVRLGDSVKFINLSGYKPEDFLISRVAWSPDSKSVIFQAQDREQTFLDVNAGSVETGRTRRLFTDRTRAWVEVIDNPTFLKDGTFIFQSERDGFKHLYHYGRDGKLIDQITRGKWEISAFHGFDEANGFAYFSAIGENGDWLNTHVYRIKLDGTGKERLTRDSGANRAVFNKDFSYFVNVRSDAMTPPQTKLHRADGSVERVLDENPTPVLEEYALSRPEFLKVKTRDGFEMEAMMIKPPDFDPNRRYPVMAYTYSGPHAPQVRNQWGGNRFMWHQMLAQKGYIVWIVDNRTGSGKGADSTWDVYRRMGQAEVPDLEDGFTYLKSLPYVDPDRLGMWGWSYGGYITSYFMTQSKTLKMGIAGGLVADWSLYDSIYTERYMLMPKNNPNGYSKGSVLANAASLHGRLLIIHGTMDDNVHMQNAIKLAYELQRAGKQFDFMPYPTQRHGVVNPLQAKHMYTMMTEYILRNL
jgi:dipeptidyl-peptidase-4